LPIAAQELPKVRADVAHPGGTIAGAPKLALVKIADGFHDPVGVASAHDGTGRLFVVERVGRVIVVDKSGKVQPTPFIDLTKINPLGNEVQTGFVEQGLWSVAFDPKFKENGYVYLHYSSLPFNGAGVVLRVTVDKSSPDVVTADQIVKTAKVIMQIEQPYYNHNGGMIQFGPDGYLYISRGDGGWEGDPLNAGQDIGVYWGKILRINVNVPDDDIPYLVPKDNPFYAATKKRLMFLFGVSEEDFSHIKTRAKPEIWAYGLRNPYQFHFDPKSGDLFIADVGQNHWEEIDWQPHNSKGGENYGWALNMGTHCFPMTGQNDVCPQVGVLPIAEYPHEQAYPDAPKVSKGSGCSVIGLGVANYGGLTKTYLAGDWCSGRLFGVAWDSSAKKWQLQEFAQTQLQFTSGNNDEDGTVVATNCYCFYTADQGPLANPPGALWRILPADKVPAGAEVAREVKAKK
jgi:glucose/arabinose dehydrogenase